MKDGSDNATAAELNIDDMGEDPMENTLAENKAQGDHKDKDTKKGRTKQKV